MSDYRPEIDNPIPLILLIPTSVQKVKATNKKEYSTVEDALKVLDKNEKPVNLFFGSFKTYGGTQIHEKNVNGIYSIEDTATIKTWYRPDIKSDCRIARADDKAIFEIINEPEDVNQRHQFLIFKVKRIKGGV